MVTEGIKSIDVYPEHRCSERPTANAIFELFENIYTYQIIEGDAISETFKDELDDTQSQIVKLLGMTEEEYWGTSD